MRDAGFWSSDILTGTQTAALHSLSSPQFWSSDILTGTQTAAGVGSAAGGSVAGSGAGVGVGSVPAMSSNLSPGFGFRAPLRASVVALPPPLAMRHRFRRGSLWLEVSPRCRQDMKKSRPVGRLLVRRVAAF